MMTYPTPPTDRREHEDALDFQDLAGIMYIALNAALQNGTANEKELVDAVGAFVHHARDLYKSMDMRDKLFWERGIDNNPWNFKVSAIGLLPAPSRPEDN